MIEVTDQDYFNSVMNFAEKANKVDNLREKLDYLGSYADHENTGLTKCLLYKDWAPYSFEFVMLRRDSNGEYKRWFNGGLIFHGNHDGGGNGGAPTFSVCLTPTDGWSIHT